MSRLSINCALTSGAQCEQRQLERPRLICCGTPWPARPSSRDHSRLFFPSIFARLYGSLLSSQATRDPMQLNFVASISVLGHPSRVQGFFSFLEPVYGNTWEALTSLAGIKSILWPWSRASTLPLLDCITLMTIKTSFVASLLFAASAFAQCKFSLIYLLITL